MGRPSSQGLVDAASRAGRGLLVSLVLAAMMSLPPWSIAQQPAAGQTYPGGTRSAPPAVSPAAGQGPQSRLPPAGSPFQMSPQEAQYLDHVLDAWERRNEKIQTLSCLFTRWDYNTTFGEQAKNFLAGQREGEIRYARPDKGLFHVYAGDQNDPEQKWICDGKSIYEFDFATRTRKEHPLPPELQGRAIADGPLPFLFGQTAANLKRRYFLRVVATPQSLENEIGLEIYPRYRQDASNFAKAEMILRANDLLPHAVKLDGPGGTEWEVYQFRDFDINSPLDRILNRGMRPTAPLGWKKMVETPADPEAVQYGPTVGSRPQGPRRPQNR